jgi:hypothetical protein
MNCGKPVRLRIPLIISSICLLHGLTSLAEPADSLSRIEFLGHEIRFEGMKPLPESSIRDIGALERIDERLSATAGDLVGEMKAIRKEKGLCDWLSYQLIRKVSERLAPKKRDYFTYTATKWHFLKALGYEPLLGVGGDRILLYVRTSERVYNLPVKSVEGGEYVCLNFHDYGFDEDVATLGMDFLRTQSAGGRDFSFQIDRLPEFPESSYVERSLEFPYGRSLQTFHVRTNELLRQFLSNYPVTDYNNQFGIPLSPLTRSSLVEPLRKKLSGMSREKGLEYLLALTRHAFPFANDSESFGREKRLSAEETLAYGNSDCEDRAALFFCLVREIYDLPMIVLSYPDHVTVAVKLDGAHQKGIVHEGERYLPCEPTPQSRELRLGEMLPHLEGMPFEVIHSHRPKL